jgi:hypothetical protein
LVQPAPAPRLVPAHLGSAPFPLAALGLLTAAPGLFPAALLIGCLPFLLKPGRFVTQGVQPLEVADDDYRVDQRGPSPVLEGRWPCFSRCRR